MIEYQSPSVEKVWGYSGDDLDGTSVHALVHPEDREVAENLFEQALSRPWLSMAAELRLRLADDSWCHFDATVTNLLRDSTGRRDRRDLPRHHRAQGVRAGAVTIRRSTIR